MDWCCDDMQYYCQREQECQLHKWHECPDVIMHRFDRRDGTISYGIPIHDGGSSTIYIDHCPWCGFHLEDFHRGRAFIDHLNARE